MAYLLAYLLANVGLPAGPAVASLAPTRLLQHGLEHLHIASALAQCTNQAAAAWSWLLLPACVVVCCL